LNDPVRIGESYQRRFDFTNTNAADFGGGRIQVIESSYYLISVANVPFIRSQGNATIYLEMKVKGGVIIDDLPELMQFQFQGQTTSFTHTLVDFTKEMFSYLPASGCGSKQLNICLFGIAGATKSSFLNSVLTLMSKETKPVFKAVAGGVRHHVTQEIGRYEIAPNIRIYDTWGLTKDTYTGKELDLLLQGVLPPGYEMHDAITDELIEQGTANRFIRKIHSVLFFLPQAALADPNQMATRKLLQENFEAISRKAGLNPLLVLTRVDEISGIRKDCTKKYTELESIKQRASQLLNIIPARVEYNINYLEEKKRAFHIDKMTYIILEDAVRSAFHYTSRIEVGSKKWNFDE